MEINKESQQSRDPKKGEQGNGTPYASPIKETFSIFQKHVTINWTIYQVSSIAIFRSCKLTYRNSRNNLVSSLLIVVQVNLPCSVYFIFAIFAGYFTKYNSQNDHEQNQVYLQCKK